MIKLERYYRYQTKDNFLLIEISTLLKFSSLILETKTVDHYIKMVTSSETIGIKNNACKITVYQTFKTIFTTHTDQDENSNIKFHVHVD